ncbi:MAG: hypothetical protein F6K45_07570 [Kamptonema sp. SIO1D9]|nr:hypothetical protein [Kamptonema sp. SIO1D9]
MIQFCFCRFEYPFDGIYFSVSLDFPIPWFRPDWELINWVLDAYGLLPEPYQPPAWDY